MIRFTTILFCIMAVVAPVRAQRIHWVEPGSGQLPNGTITHFDDTTARLRIDEVVALSGRFKPLTGSLLNEGYTASHHWLHLRLHSRTPQTAFLDVDNPRINTFRCYQFVATGRSGARLVSQVIAGDERPFEARGFPTRNWVVPVTLDAQSPVDLYVLVAKRHEVLGVRVQAWAGQTFERNDRDSYLWWGILTGFTILLLLINGVVLVATRQAVYCWFIGLIGAVAFHIATQSGLGFQYLWSNWPAFNRFDPQLLSGWLIMLMQLRFMQQFIGQRAGPRMAGQRRAFGAVRLFQYSLLAGLVLNVVLRAYDVFPESHFRWTFNATLLLTVVSILLAFWSIVERLGQRETVVLFYTFTFTVQLVGYLLVFVVNLAFTWGSEPLFQFDSYVIVVLNFLFDLLILSSGILYFWFESYRRQNEQLLTTLHQQQQAQSGRIIEALEIERNRIAEDLYDDVGAMLSTAIGYVSSVLRKPDVRERFPLLTDARHLLDRAVDNLRTVSHNLMPKNFAELGLAKSLAETIDKVSASTDIRFQFIQIGVERRLEAGTEVQIFRIAAELINDIVKNSHATQATLQLVYGPEALLLMTEDDGPNPPQYTNLHSKLAFVNGRIDSDVSPDGVTVRIEIPY